MPEISVILPVYQGERYLREALSSVLSQTVQDFEFLIRDDGSQDGSIEIIESFKDNRIRLIKNQGRLGLFGNLNALIQESQSNLVHLFCQDDVLETHCLEQELQFFQNHPDIGFSYCKSTAIDSHGVVTPASVTIDLPVVMQPELSLQHFFYHGCIPGNLSTVCVRKSSFQTVGLFDSSLKVSGDYELWARMATRFPLGVIHQSLVRLRHHEMRLSHQPESALKFVRENRKIRKGLLPLLPLSCQKEALTFEINRHGVMEFHQGLHALLRGHWPVAKEMFFGQGPTQFFRSVFYWMVTGNNRFYRPQAQWVLPEDYQL